MCERCIQIDGSVARYRRIVDQALDQLTRRRTSELVDALEGEKRQLHPEVELQLRRQG
jgi:hypothetical protein